MLDTAAQLVGQSNFRHVNPTWGGIQSRHRAGELMLKSFESDLKSQTFQPLVAAWANMISMRILVTSLYVYREKNSIREKKIKPNTNTYAGIKCPRLWLSKIALLRFLVYATPWSTYCYGKNTRHINFIFRTPWWRWDLRVCGFVLLITAALSSVLVPYRAFMHELSSFNAKPIWGRAN